MSTTGWRCRLNSKETRYILEDAKGTRIGRVDAEHVGDRVVELLEKLPAWADLTLLSDPGLHEWLLSEGFRTDLTVGYPRQEWYKDVGGGILFVVRTSGQSNSMPSIRYRNIDPGAPAVLLPVRRRGQLLRLISVLEGL